MICRPTPVTSRPPSGIVTTSRSRLITGLLTSLLVCACESVPNVELAADAGDIVEVRANSTLGPGEPGAPGSVPGPALGGPASTGVQGSAGGDPAATPLNPGTDVRTQAQSGAPLVQTCAADGAMRCGASAGQRELCMGGAWVTTDPCPEGNVCIMPEGAQIPGCEAVAAVCQGSAGQTVCDGNGAMYQCSESGLVEGMTMCASARHCQLGKPAGACAVCAPGTPDGFTCDGATLMRCTPLGDGYEPAKTCDTASLCNATAGDCTDGACSPGQYVCEGDTLKLCNADQTALDMVKACGPGLCDAQAADCDVCTAGEATCDGNTTVVCNDQGTLLEQVPCPSVTPVCVGEGRCVECQAADDCQDPGACSVANCDPGRGACEPTPARADTACMNGMGYCDGRGTCLGCNAASQCDDPPACHERRASRACASHSPSAEVTAASAWAEASA